MRKIFWVLILIPLICAVLICGLDAYLRWSSENYITEETIMMEDGWIRDFICKGCAGHFDGFSIAFGGAIWQRYTDENGVRKLGLVAGLHMVTAEPNADRPTDELFIDLHKGQEVTFGGYRIKVIDIEMEGGLFSFFIGDYSVDLLIKPPETQ